MNFDTLRQRFPDRSDEDILRALQQTRFPDYSITQIAKAAGYKPRARSMGAAANDTVIEFGNAVAGAAGSVAEFVSPGNEFSAGVKRFQQEGEAKQSDAVKWEKQQLSDDLAAADGFGEEAAAVGRHALRNPGLVLAQGVGSFAVPGAAVKGAQGAARVLGAGEKAMGWAGRAGGAAAGAAMGGGDAAGTAYEAVMGIPVEKLMQTPEAQSLMGQGLNPDQVQKQLATSAARDASIVPALIGAVTGATGAEAGLAGARKVSGNALTRFAKGAATEGLQEAVEEGVTQYSGQKAAQQYDPDIDAMKGVGASAAFGAITGGVMGGAVDVMHKPDSAKLGEAADERRKQIEQQGREAQADMQAGFSPDVSIDDFIGLAERVADRPRDDLTIRSKQVGQLAEEVMDSEAYQRADQARLEKLRSTIDDHVALLDAANADPANGEAQAAVSKQLAEGFDQATPAEQADTDFMREQAGLAPAATELTSTPAREPGIQWLDTTPLTDQNQARTVLAEMRTRASEFNTTPESIVMAPHPTVPGAIAIRKIAAASRTAGISASDNGSTLQGVGTDRSQPISARASGKVDTTDYVDLTPLTREQAEQRADSLRKWGRADGVQGDAGGWYDTTPMRPGKYASKSLALAREQAAERGVDPKRLSLAAHPTEQGRVAIQISGKPGQAAQLRSGAPKISDPQRLQVVPHPNGRAGQFALRYEPDAATIEARKDRANPTQQSYSPELQGNRAERQGPIDEVALYVNAMRKTNTPAARAFVQAYDAGQISDAEVMRAMGQEGKAAGSVDSNVVTGLPGDRPMLPGNTPAGSVNRVPDQAKPGDVSRGMTRTESGIYVPTAEVSGAADVSLPGREPGAPAPREGSKPRGDTVERDSITKPEETRIARGGMAEDEANYARGEWVGEEQERAAPNLRGDGLVRRNGMVTRPTDDSRREEATSKPRGEAEGERGAGIAEGWKDKQKLGELGKTPAGKESEGWQDRTGTPEEGEGAGKSGRRPEADKDPGWTEDKPTNNKPLNRGEFGAEFATQANNAELMQAVQAQDLPKVLDILGKAKSPTVRRTAQMMRNLVAEVRIMEWPRTNKVRGQFMNPDHVGGFYDPVHDSVHFRPAMDRKKAAPVRSTEGNEHVVAHELLHALMHQALAAPTEAQQPYVTRLQALFKHVRRELKGNSDYGLSDIHEFVSEAWSNPKFQAKLAGIKYGKQSAWSKFVDFIAGLLGTRDKSALTAVLQLSEQIAAQPRDRSQYSRRSQMGPVRSPADVATGEKIADLVEAAKKRPEGNKLFMVYRPLDASRVAVLKAATGLDLSGYAHGVDEAAIRHILKRHGEGGEDLRGVEPITAEDFKLLPELTDATKAVAVRREYDHDSKLARISYETELNGNLYVVEEVRTGRKRLALVTMYRKARAAPGASPEGAVPLTPETFGAQPGASVADDPMAPKAVKLAESQADAMAEELAPSRDGLNEAQRAVDRRIFSQPDERTHKERFTDGLRNLREGFKDRFITGVLDQYHALKKLDGKAYMLARLSHGADGALEAMMLGGKLKLKDGATVMDDVGKGFASVLADLGGEHQRFFKWVAGLRAEQLYALGKERLMSPEDIATIQTFNQGKMADGRDRAAVYGDALAQLTEFNDSVLRIAQESGLISQEMVDQFAGMPYVPFYRVLEEAGKVGGPGYNSEALVGQRAWKTLKGGDNILNGDLLANTLRNWSHLLHASAKNRAAVAAMQEASAAGMAEKVSASEAGTVRVMVDGKAAHYAVSDAPILEAITALHYVPPDNMFFKAMVATKRWLTLGVTTLPDFKIRNLIRDSLQAVALADLDPNALKNLAKGAEVMQPREALFNLARTLVGKTPKTFAPMNRTYMDMLASGAMMRFGSMTEGSTSTHAESLVRRAGGVMLDKQGFAKFLQHAGDALEAYQELGDRGEQVNRAALYQRLLEKGMTEAEAAFASRDLLDFSLQGKLPAVRFLVQTVPFLNARMQGLYKLGRSGMENPKRMGAAVSAVVLASMALYLAAADDDDFKARDDWDRDSFWWFKVGDTAFRIPKPFELGAAGTLAERTWEYMVDPEMTGSRYADRISSMLFQTFAFDPTPQVVKPIRDIYANKDSFRGSPIEGRAMQAVRPEDRYNDRTSEVAKFMGSLGLPDPVSLITGKWSPSKAEGTLSPVQIDYLIRGYFGSLGAMLVGVMDQPAVMAGDRPERPSLTTKQMTWGFVDSLEGEQSRYVNALYERANEVTQAYQSYRAALKSGDKGRAAELLAEVGPKIARNSQAMGATRAMSEVNAQIKRVMADRELTGAEKRAKLADLYKVRNARAKALAETLPD